MKSINQNFTGQDNCPKCGEQATHFGLDYGSHREGDAIDSCDSCEIYWARRDNVDRVYLKGDDVIWRYRYPHPTANYQIQWEEEDK